MAESKATLELKTVAELREICKARGITGMSKKRKDIVVDALIAADKSTTASKVAKSAPAVNSVVKDAKSKDVAAIPGPVTAAQFNMSSILTHPSRSFGDKTTTTIQVSCGANSAEFPVLGKTVGAVQEFLKEVLNIDRVAEGKVSGKAVSTSYVLQEGDVLEFIKPAGRKG